MINLYFARGKILFQPNSHPGSSQSGSNRNGSRDRNHRDRDRRRLCRHLTGHPAAQLKHAVTQFAPFLATQFIGHIEHPALQLPASWGPATQFERVRAGQPGLQLRRAGGQFVDVALPQAILQAGVDRQNAVGQPG